MGKFSAPKAPVDSPEVKLLRRQQLAEAERLEQEENERKKAIARGRLGTRQLLSGSSTGIEDEQAALSLLSGTRAGRSSAGSASSGTRRLVRNRRVTPTETRSQTQP